MSPPAAAITVAATAPSTNGASAVGQHDHARPALGPAQRMLHLGRARAELAVVGAARRDDGHRAAADLRGQVRRAVGESGAVRDEDDSDGGSADGLGSHGIS